MIKGIAIQFSTSSTKESEIWTKNLSTLINSLNKILIHSNPSKSVKLIAGMKLWARFTKTRNLLCSIRAFLLKMKDLLLMLVIISWKLQLYWWLANMQLNLKILKNITNSIKSIPKSISLSLKATVKINPCLIESLMFSTYSTNLSKNKKTLMFVMNTSLSYQMNQKFNNLNKSFNP